MRAGAECSVADLREDMVRRGRGPEWEESSGDWRRCSKTG